MGVDQHQQGNGGDQGQHHGSQRIHHVAHRQAEAAGASPNKQMFDRGCTVELFKQHGVADHRCGTDTAEQQDGDRLAQAIDRSVETDQSHAGDQRSDQRKHWNQPGVVSGRVHPDEAGFC